MLQKAPEYSRMIKKVLKDPIRFQNDPEGSRRYHSFQIAPESSKNYQEVLKDPRESFRMIHQVQKHSKMIQKAIKGFRMIQKVLDRSRKYQKVMDEINS